MVRDAHPARCGPVRWPLNFGLEKQQVLRGPAPDMYRWAVLFPRAGGVGARASGVPAVASQDRRKPEEPLESRGREQAVQ